jgi:hypothetical protein
MKQELRPFVGRGSSHVVAASLASYAGGTADAVLPMENCRSPWGVPHGERQFLDIPW